MKICPACSREYGDERDACPEDGASLVHLDTGVGARPEELVGEVIDGRYRVEGIVGRGGMGTVYACRHVIVGKAFAMKVLRPGIERNEEILQRFIREAQAANAIPSRHICQMIDFGQLRHKGGAFYVVMELLEGRSLTKALRNEELDRAALDHIFVNIAETLEKAHAAGIVHRDLKPDNVMLIEDEGDPHFVKLVDFGIAKALQDKTGDLTETGVILGTPFYMSPEQARGESLDGRSDIYSLGVMMYRAFTGKLPFVADTAMGVLTRHLTEAPEPPSRIREIEPGLEAIILRCLEKRAGDRFQRMAEVAQAIRSLRQHHPSQSFEGAYVSGEHAPPRASLPSVDPMHASGPYASHPGVVSTDSARLQGAALRSYDGAHTPTPASLQAYDGAHTPTPASLQAWNAPHASGSSYDPASMREGYGAQASQPSGRFEVGYPGETNRGLVAPQQASPPSGAAGRRVAMIGIAAALFVTIGAVAAIAVVQPDDATPAASGEARPPQENGAPSVRANDRDEATEEASDDEANEATAHDADQTDERAEPGGDGGAGAGSDPAGSETAAPSTAVPPRPFTARPPQPTKPPEPGTSKPPIDDGVRSPFEENE